MSDTELPRILCVDDEPNVTAGIQRTFFDEFDIDTASSGEEALQMVASEGPYTAIVSDMRMPQMDGATLLGRIRRQAPETVRLLLTGYAEVDAAIAAVNDGNIFRFLCKPCPEETLRTALRDAVRQHELVRAERMLLEDTLHGAVKVLVDVLGLAVPQAFTRAEQIRACVGHVADEVGIQNRWELDLAAMLSHVGYVSVPPDVLAKQASGQQLDAEEKKLLAGQAEVGYSLLRRIPRLLGVACIVRGDPNADEVARCGPTVARDIALLSLAREMDALTDSGLSARDAVARLRSSRRFPDDWMEALASFDAASSGPRWSRKELNVNELSPGMRLEGDVVSPSGGLLIPKGREVTSPMIERLRTFAQRKAVVQPIIVAVQSVR